MSTVRSFLQKHPEIFSREVVVVVSKFKGKVELALHTVTDGGFVSLRWFTCCQDAQ